MAEAANPFKAYFNETKTQELAGRIETVYPAFPSERFVRRVAAEINALELKARVNLIRDALYETLPADYPAALDILITILGTELPAEDGMFNDGFWIMPVAAYVQQYGLDHFEPSMRGLYEITKRFTSEEAIRPYIVRYPDRVLSMLHTWTADPSAHVRRLVSEGTRTRLPWAMRLPMFIENPYPVFELLEKLKDDSSLYVRRSVANNLNDIAKDHPDLVVSRLTTWRNGASAERQWLIKHALRHLIKQGDTGALGVLGYAAEHGISVESFALSTDSATIGDTITLTASLVNRDSIPHDAVIDYRVHYVKANGKTSPKVFKWATVHLEPNAAITLTKKHAFRDVSIRVHRPGIHPVDVQVNGRVLAETPLTLEAKKP